MNSCIPQHFEKQGQLTNLWPYFLRETELPLLSSSNIGENLSFMFYIPQTKTKSEDDNLTFAFKVKGNRLDLLLQFYP